MNRFLFYSTIISCIFAVPVGAQDSVKPKAPIIPKETMEPERTSLSQCALCLTKGKYDLAMALLKPLQAPAVTKVFVDYAAVPKDFRADYKEAVSKSIHVWNEALAGGLRFQAAEREEDADLTILFQRDVALSTFGQARLVCTDTVMEPVSTGRRAARAYIALLQPYAPTAHAAASAAHQVGQSIGAYLGLAPSTNSDDIMGPDTHTPTVSVKPSVADIGNVKQIQTARAKLMEYAQHRTAIYMPKAVAAFEKNELDAGDVWRGESPKFVFNIKNSGDAPLEIFAKPNCGCTVANYDKVIAPGATGKIEAAVNTTSFRGKIYKLIDVTSNDLENPKTSLRMVANVKSVMTVLPSETPIIGLKDSEKTVHELQLKIAEKDPVQISRATCSVPYATAEVEPVAADPNSYTLRLNVTSAAPLGRSAFMVTVLTTSKREPQLNITAICEKGILAVPLSVYLGNITPQTVMPVNQIVTLSRREGTFKVKSVKTDDPNLEITQEALQNGSQYRLALKYKGGWAAGAVRRKITIETDDPRQQTIEIPVMATIATAALAPNIK
jgi:hypothetical protein